MLRTSIKLQLANSPKQVTEIVKTTILSIYPKYYPRGAVQFFLNLHCEEHIKAAMEREEVYLLLSEGKVIGTGSIRDDEICRLFILPEYQRKGYGSKLMDVLEERIFQKYLFIHIDASFPAESMYLKRNYQISSYKQIETENGDFLCYHVMEKRKLCT